MIQIVLIAHNVRSAHNVGSLLRTADGLGIDKVFLTGYTPYPTYPNDRRLPHEAAKISRRIHKTALGAEENLEWQFRPEINPLLTQLKEQKYTICALEQSRDAKSLPTYKPKAKVALIVGNEVTGLETEILKRADIVLEIPMSGKKESFNVVQAAAMALYHLHFLHSN